MIGNEGNWWGAFGHRPGGNKGMLPGLPPALFLALLVLAALCAMGVWL